MEELEVQLRKSTDFMRNKVREFTEMMETVEERVHNKFLRKSHDILYENPEEIHPDINPEEIGPETSKQ